MIIMTNVAKDNDEMENIDKFKNELFQQKRLAIKR